MVAKALISAPPTCWEKRGVLEKEGETRARNSYQTNKTGVFVYVGMHRRLFLPPVPRAAAHGSQQDGCHLKCGKSDGSDCFTGAYVRAVHRSLTV